MSDLRIKRSFNEIRQECMSEQFGLLTIVHLITKIRLHRKELSSDQIKNLLEIPIDVLSNDVVLKDKEDFQEHGANYFLENLAGYEEEHEFIKHFAALTQSKKLILTDMVAFTKYIQITPAYMRENIR